MLKDIHIALGKDNQEILELSRALSSPQRLEILQLLNTSSFSVKELADYIGAPLSSTLLNVNILSECGLVEVKEIFTKNGKSKICSRNCDRIGVDIFREEFISNNHLSHTIAIGNYCDYKVPVNAGCGIATKEHTLGVDNDTDVFFHEEHYKAAYIWLTEGFLKYKVSKKLLPHKLNHLSISFEVCSEAPFYRNDWKSDITLILCGKEIGTWTSLGDYGGRRGKNNPKWWPDALTQFGVLTNWDIRKDGTYVNDNKISDVTLDDIDFKSSDCLSLEIGVKKDAKYCGGLSLFGKNFGDYAQDIIMTFYSD